MTISTFNAVVSSTDKPYHYLAKARNFKVNFIGKEEGDQGITAKEGIMAALGSCETIVTAGVYTKYHEKFNNFRLGITLTDKQFHVSFFLNDKNNLFPEIVQAIKDTSPVYDNIIHKIPIEITEVKVKN